MGTSQFSSVQSLSFVQLFATPWTAARQASLSITNSWSLLKLMPIESLMPSNHFILSSPSPPAFNLSQHQGLSNESALPIRWPKYWSFSLSIGPSVNIQGWFPLGFNWFNLLAVQGTLKSPLQHHSSKVSILWCSAFFMVYGLTSLHDYWKNSIQTFEYTDICQQNDFSAF